MILFELIAGCPAFAGTTMSELFINIATEPPQRLRALRPEASVEIENVILRCRKRTPIAALPM